MARSYSYEIYDKENRDRWHVDDGFPTHSSAKTEARLRLSDAGSPEYHAIVYRRYANGDWGNSACYALVGKKLTKVKDG